MCIVNFEQLLSLIILSNIITSQLTGYRKESVQSRIETLHDYRADIFHFSFMGKSGLFFWGTDKKWKVQSEDNISVIFDIDDDTNYTGTCVDEFPYASMGVMPKTIKGFTLIDDQGVRYYFSAREYVIDCMNTHYNNYWNTWNASCWHLTSVSDRLGNRLYDFGYEAGPPIFQANYSKVDYYFNSTSVYQSLPVIPYQISLHLPKYLSYIDVYDNKDFPVTEIQFIYNTSDTFCLHGEEIYPLSDPSIGNSNYHVLIEELCKLNVGQYINYDYYDWLRHDQIKQYTFKLNGISEGTIQGMLHKTGIRPLGEICIKRDFNSSDNPIEIFSFRYSREGKLHLNEVEMAVLDNEKGWEKTEILGKYKMTYSQYNRIPSEYYSKKINVWGYYNGYSGLELKYSSKITLDCGMLSKIEYPTGGYSTFLYEPNDCSKYIDGKTGRMIDSLSYVGGLRIKSITTIDPLTAVSSTRTFFYTHPNSQTSSGICGYWPVFDSYQGLGGVYVSHSDMSFTPLSSALNPGVGYSWVTEISDNIKTEFQYTNFETYNDTYPDVRFFQSFYDRRGDRGFMRGKLLKKIIRDDQNSIIQETENIYCISNDEDSGMSVVDAYHARVMVFDPIFDNSMIFEFDRGSIYPIFLNKFNLCKSRVSTFSGGSNPIVENTDYVYNYITLKENDPKYRFLVSSNKYIEAEIYNGYRIDYTYPIDESQYSDCFIENFYPLISEDHYVKNSLLKSIKYVYDSSDGNYLPRYEIQKYYNSNNPVTSIVNDTLISYDSYDGNGILLKFTEKGKPQTRLFWDPYYGVLLGSVCGSINLDSIIINDNEDFEIAFRDTDMYNLFKFNNKSIFEIPNTTAVVYRYNSRGLLKSITKGLNNTIYYDYDLFNRLYRIRDNRGSIIQKFYYHYVSGNI